MLGEYIIIGDTKDHKDCLVYVCGTKENAENVLNRMLTNPDKYDLHYLKKHSNLRVVFSPAEDNWWNDPFLAN